MFRNFVLLDATLATGAIECVHFMPIDDILKYTCQIIVAVGALLKMFIQFKLNKNQKKQNK